MATGRMAGDKAVIRKLAHFMLLVAGCLSASFGWAFDVGLAGVTPTRAILIIDGGPPKIFTVGQSTDGVKLLAIQPEGVVVEIESKKRSLRVGQHAVGTVDGDSGKLVLTADGQGHFFATGTVNGTSVRFMVDTGATMISLGANDARRIGLDGNQGQRIMTQTANGQAEVSQIKLDIVRIGDITLRNIDAVIHQNDMPVALLGMSFLNRLEMQRDGSSMTLKRRF